MTHAAANRPLALKLRWRRMCHSSRAAAARYSAISVYSKAILKAVSPPPGTKVSGSRCGARKNSPCSAATSTSTAAVISVACERVAVLPQGSQATASRASALSSRADSQ